MRVFVGKWGMCVYINNKNGKWNKRTESKGFRCITCIKRLTKNKINRGQRNQIDIIFLFATFKNKPFSCENEIVEMETDKKQPVSW